MFGQLQRSLRPREALPQQRLSGFCSLRFPCSMIMGQRGDLRIVTSRTAIQTAFLNAALDTLPEHVGSVGKCSCRRRSAESRV